MLIYRTTDDGKPLKKCFQINKHPVEYPHFSKIRCDRFVVLILITKIWEQKPKARSWEGGGSLTVGNFKNYCKYRRSV